MYATNGMDILGENGGSLSKSIDSGYFEKEGNGRRIWKKGCRARVKEAKSFFSDGKWENNIGYASLA